MKGRPITTEEFERMLGAVAGVMTKGLRKEMKRLAAKPDQTRDLRAKAASLGERADEITAAWQRLLRGLWWSGLRLGEALSLEWEGHGLKVELTGRRPMFQIPAEGEKGHQDRILPMAPEFAEMLLVTAVEERTGFVFPVPTERGEARRIDTVSRTIVAIGKAAGVKVHSERKGDVDAVKYASAHDLRRAFGLRWSNRVMPPILQQLMRHESIETTLRFYVGRDAEATADVLWESVSGNSRGNTSETAEQEHSEIPRK